MTDEQLPDEVTVSQSFIARLPSQRVIDMLQKMEPGLNFGELLESQPPRIIAFRALLRQFPDRDTTSLWMHAYDVEVVLTEVDPTNGNGLTPSQPSAPTSA
jgi:hypothetical protein